ncbi:hypothetical protein ACIBH1_14130 [Nonomuraea sp. NPDC050663]|uniref:hypothetical protein n=1 Tax=Nonomuraea sp. NPDC050663 TaxID=3364370 RepID=UPI0037A392DB
MTAGYLDLAFQVISGAATADTLVALACVLSDLDHDTPAVRELLERPTADLTPEDLHRLADALTAPYRSWRTAIDLVTHDMHATGATGEVTLAVPDWDPDGVRLQVDDHFSHDRVPFGGDVPTYVADAVQEAVMEASFTVWPLCPDHDLGLHAENGAWACRRGHVVARIGHLGTPSD